MVGFLVNFRWIKYFLKSLPEYSFLVNLEYLSIYNRSEKKISSYLAALNMISNLRHVSFDINLQSQTNF